MTHQNLGVATGLLLELSLLVLLEAAGGGGEESARDTRGHCDDGLLRLWEIGGWVSTSELWVVEALKFSYDFGGSRYDEYEHHHWSMPGSIVDHVR